MKRMLFSVVLLSMVLSGFQAVFGQDEEPTVYVIQKGDTLWGLSDRFLHDPFYWPDLWARNPKDITNPHLIFPGQRLKVYPDRIEVESAVPEAEAPAEVAPEAVVEKAPPVEEKVAPEQKFAVVGSDGYLLEKGFRAAGMIIANQENRQMAGEGDFTYTDIGSVSGARVDQRYNVCRNMGTVSHPVTSEILGSKVIPVGDLKLAEMEEKTSKALVTNSFQEIKVGDYLMPYRNRKREIPLRAADRDLSGYVVESQTGAITIGTGEVVFLDLGREQGLMVGNLLYVVREVSPEQSLFDFRPLGKLPDEVIGAVVVVGAGRNTSAALVVKSSRAIYRGDRVELRKSL